MSIKWRLLSFVIWCMLGITRLLILLMPFKKLVRLMGKANGESNRVLPEKDQRRAIKVGKMISFMSQFTPWDSKCFPQALTGLIVLRLFGIPSTIYFGVCKESNDLSAHAWLRSGNKVVTGEEEMKVFLPVAKYARIIKKKECYEDVIE